MLAVLLLVFVIVATDWIMLCLGMIQVVQYLLRDIEQWELWTELERRVNMLDPSVYDRTIQYPRRFTFLILGLLFL